MTSASIDMTAAAEKNGKKSSHEQNRRKTVGFTAASRAQTLDEPGPARPAIAAPPELVVATLSRNVSEVSPQSLATTQSTPSMQAAKPARLFSHLSASSIVKAAPRGGRNLVRAGGRAVGRSPQKSRRKYLRLKRQLVDMRGQAIAVREHVRSVLDILDSLHTTLTVPIGVLALFVMFLAFACVTGLDDYRETGGPSEFHLISWIAWACLILWLAISLVVVLVLGRTGRRLGQATRRDVASTLMASDRASSTSSYPSRIASEPIRARGAQSESSAVTDTSQFSAIH
jgi:hypothetical protein